MLGFEGDEAAAFAGVELRVSIGGHPTECPVDNIEASNDLANSLKPDVVRDRAERLDIGLAKNRALTAGNSTRNTS